MAFNVWLRRKSQSRLSKWISDSSKHDYMPYLPITNNCFIFETPILLFNGKQDSQCVRSDLLFFFLSKLLCLFPNAVNCSWLGLKSHFLQESAVFRSAHRFTATLQIGFRRISGFFWRASGILLESVEFSTSPPVAGWQRMAYLWFTAFDHRPLPSLIKMFQFK